MTQRNIILIGMPGSGKTTVGQAVADALGMLFLDVDQEIVKVAGKSIAAIFAEDGEAVFRDLETKVLAACCRRQGVVIATGGGAILRSDNREAMRSSGLVCQLLRDVNKLALRDGRPLSTDLETVKAMAVRRASYYETTRHIVIDNNGDVQDAVSAIIGAYREITRH